MKTFYETLQPIEHITQITEPQHYVAVPDDWWVAASDVVSSTKAIEHGRYKDVNAVAAACITAMLNVAQQGDIPFVFGGDGASVLVPPAMKTDAEAALRGTRALAQEQFGLDLRVGMVPVADIYAAGYRMDVAKHKIAEDYQQAVFTGGGLSHAERLLKADERYQLSEDGDATADFFGLECRWQEINSPYEETVSLIIQSNTDDTAVYAEILSAIEQIYGDPTRRHPISLNHLKMTFNPNLLQVEAKIRQGETSWRVFRRMIIGSLKAWFAMRFNIGQWGTYKDGLIATTDNEKFDDALRMTISGTANQRVQLVELLHQQYRAGNIMYGVHAAPYALMTCIVFDYFGRQVHFIDSGEGGYALAAKQMKAQHRGF